MKHITLTHNEWKAIKQRIIEEYPPSVYLIRDKMKQVLGFTVREHRRWLDPESEEQVETFEDTWSEIHLDFYDEQLKTMFILKYYEQNKIK